MTDDTDTEMVKVRLDDGERLTLSPDELERVYDELWILAGRMKGAVRAAAKLKHIEPWDLLHGGDRLDAEETVALRAALARVR